MNPFFLKHILILPFVILLSLGGTLYAIDDTLENEVRVIAHKLRCPTCQSQSVKDSDAGLSVNMKTKIRSMLQEGKEETEILDYFVERYGEWILRSPQKKGINLFLWLMPGVILVISSGLLIIAMRKRTFKNTQSAENITISDKQRKQIDKDLEKLDFD